MPTMLRYLVLLPLCATVCLGDEQSETADGPTHPQAVTWRPVRTRSDQDLLRLQAATKVMEGRLHQRRGDSERALRCYQRAFRFDPNASVVLRQIVPLALEMGRVGVATRYAVLLAGAELDDPLLAEQLAMFLSDQAEYRKSLKLFQRVLQLQAREPQPRELISIHFEMGRLYYLTEQYHEAASSFRTVLTAIDDPERTQVSAAIRNAILADPALTYNLMAESFLDAGEFDDAAAMFRRAAEQRPLEGWLPLQLARVDFRAGRYEQARQKLEDYRQKKHQFAGREPYRMLCELLRREQPTDGDKTIIRQFRDWQGEDPENFPLLTFVAGLCEQGGVLEEAAELYESSIQKQPTLDAYRGLAAIYRRIGDGDKLLDVLGRVTAELQGLEPLAGELKEIIKDRELLKRLFQLGRQRLAADVAIGRGIAAACGLVAIGAEEFEVADEFLTDLEQQPDAAQLWMGCGLELLLAGEHARAAQIFQRAITANVVGEDAPVFFYYLAGALQLDGRTQHALEAAREALAIKSDVPEFAQRSAWILYHAGRHAEAEQAYLDWLTEYDDDYDALGIRETVRDARFILSNICISDQRPDQAVEWLEQVLDEFPEDVGAMNDLGYLLADQGIQLQRALGMIQKSVACEPENVAYRDSLGWALYRLGRYDEAVEQLSLAATTKQSDPVILDHLADAHMAVGNRADAIRLWRQALGILEDKDGHHQQLRMRVQGKLQQQTAESH